MQVSTTSIPDLLILEPRVFGDERGFFYESFNENAFKVAVGVTCSFVHGFVTLSDTAEFLYKTTDFYNPAHEQCMAWKTISR
jgi:dTDP-4-dehydrorhamnose 3,5-epimerase-like enzyme